MCATTRKQANNHASTRTASSPALLPTDQYFLFKKSRGPMKLRVGQNQMLWLVETVFDRGENKTWNVRKMSRFAHERWVVLKNTGSWQSNPLSSKKNFQFLTKWQYFQKVHRFFESGKPAQFCVCTKFWVGRSSDILRLLWRLRNWNPRVPVTCSCFATPDRQN